MGRASALLRARLNWEPRKETHTMRFIVAAFASLLVACSGGGGPPATALKPDATLNDIEGLHEGVFVDDDEQEYEAYLRIDPFPADDPRGCGHNASLCIWLPPDHIAERPGALGSMGVAFAGFVTVEGSRARFDSFGIVTTWLVLENGRLGPDVLIGGDERHIVTRF